MSQYYKRVKLENWNQFDVKNEVEFLFNNNFEITEEFSPLCKHEIKAYRHSPNWSDFGVVSNKLIDSYAAKILDQLPDSGWVHSISILCSIGDIPIHTELHKKTVALIVPLSGAEKGSVTNFFCERGTIQDSISIAQPTLIRTDVPHNLIAYSSFFKRIVMCLRAIHPTEFENVVDLFNKSKIGEPTAKKKNLFYKDTH